VIDNYQRASPLQPVRLDQPRPNPSFATANQAVHGPNGVKITGPGYPRALSAIEDGTASFRRVGQPPRDCSGRLRKGGRSTGLF
jgi:hypothetical protein